MILRQEKFYEIGRKNEKKEQTVALAPISQNFFSSPLIMGANKLDCLHQIRFF
jgi:hypothetical protein